MFLYFILHDALFYSTYTKKKMFYSILLFNSPLKEKGKITLIFIFFDTI